MKFSDKSKIKKVIVCQKQIKADKASGINWIPSSFAIKKKN